MPYELSFTKEVAIKNSEIYINLDNSWLNFVNRPWTRRDAIRLMTGVLAVPLLGQRKATRQTQTRGLLTAELRHAVDMHQIAGSVVVVSRSRRPLLVETTGYQDMERKTPMSRGSIFDIRSMTKEVTAIAIMCLVEDGKLNLSEPLLKYLPRFANALVVERPGVDTHPPRRLATIEDVLTHTSGISGERPPEIENITRTFDRPLAEVADIIAKQPLEFEPGSRWMYSSMGFAVLGRIVEVVSNQPYETFVAERVLRPLQMVDTFYFPLPEKRDRIAAMYNIETGTLKRDSIDIYRAGAKYSAPEFGLYLTAADLHSLLLMMMNSGTHKSKKVLSAKSVSALVTPHVETSLPGISQGLGWFVGNDPEKNRDFHFTKGSFGAAGASGCFAWVDPSEGLIRIFLIQRFGGDDRLRNDVMNLAAQVVE